MISKLPWSIDENDPSAIYDADGEIIAEDYRFFHLDDFEAICDLINFTMDTKKKLEKLSRI